MRQWSLLAKQTIQQVHAALPAGATLAERTRAVDAAYPFGERSHSPYKTWLRARRNYLEVYGYRGKNKKPAAPWIFDHDFFRVPDITQAPAFSGRILGRCISDKGAS
jgi:hypothetical protein